MQLTLVVMMPQHSLLICMYLMYIQAIHANALTSCAVMSVVVGKNLLTTEKFRSLQKQIEFSMCVSCICLFCESHNYEKTSHCAPLLNMRPSHVLTIHTRRPPAHRSPVSPDCCRRGREASAAVRAPLILGLLTFRYWHESE